jgi:dynein intermediate chain 1
VFFLFIKETTTKEGEDEDEEKPKKATGFGGKAKKLTNQFNFSERASQTYNNPSRVFNSKKKVLK